MARKASSDAALKELRQAPKTLLKQLMGAPAEKPKKAAARKSTAKKPAAKKR